MINIVLFGPPGAGKGTQSEKLIAKYGFIHLSTGDIFRRNIKEATDLGQLAKSYMDQGQLVPDSVTISMLQAEVAKNNNAKGFIFDGFPRNANQANALDEFLKTNGTSITKMIALEVSEDELRIRLLERGKTSGRPDDSDPSVIQKRIDVYNNETAPVKHFYLNQNKYYGVYGVGSIDSIFNLICDVIDSINKSSIETKTENVKIISAKKAVNTSARQQAVVTRLNNQKEKTKDKKVSVAVKKNASPKKKVSVKADKNKSTKKVVASTKIKKEKKKKVSTTLKKTKKVAKRGRPAAPKKRGRPQIIKRGRPTAPKKRGRPEVKKRGRPVTPKRRGRPEVKKRGRPSIPKKRGRPEVKKRGRPSLPKKRGRPEIKKRGRPVLAKRKKKVTVISTKANAIKKAIKAPKKITKAKNLVAKKKVAIKKKQVKKVSKKNNKRRKK